MLQHDFTPIYLSPFTFHLVVLKDINCSIKSSVTILNFNLTSGLRVQRVWVLRRLTFKQPSFPTHMIRWYIKPIRLCKKTERKTLRHPKERRKIKHSLYKSLQKQENTQSNKKGCEKLVSHTRTRFFSMKVLICSTLLMAEWDSQTRVNSYVGRMDIFGSDHRIQNLAVKLCSSKVKQPSIHTGSIVNPTN